jgi:sulfur-oxidizing protein SoxZ
MSTIKIRTKRLDGMTQIRTLITHPMENGRQKNKQGETIPAHYILALTVILNDKIIITSTIGKGISKDPYFAFKIKGGEKGDKITISWQDNLGNSDTAERIVT